jgi:uncharacterized protein
MAGYPVVHIELTTKDRVKTGEFYHELFNWKIEQISEMNYATFDSGNVGGGFNPVSESNPVGTITIYIGTEDIEADLERAQALGAKIVTHKSEIPNIGWWGMFEDPDGNKIALYTSMNPQPGEASGT